MENSWEEELKEYIDDLDCVQGIHTGDSLKNFINYLLSQTRQETIEKIKELIVAEINIARTEGDKTSRLTSLFMRITELNAPKT